MVKIKWGSFSNKVSKSAKKSLKERVNLILPVLADEIVHDTDAFVPYDTGYLSDAVSISNSGKTIEYYADYAERVYNMPDSTNWNTSHHPLATGEWDIASRKQNLPKWLNSFKRMVGGK